MSFEVEAVTLMQEDAGGEQVRSERDRRDGVAQTMRRETKPQGIACAGRDFTQRAALVPVKYLHSGG